MNQSYKHFAALRRARSFSSRHPLGRLVSRNLFANFLSPKTFVGAFLTGLVCLTISIDQTPQKPPDPQGTGGVVTSTPLNYTSKRTVGITDPKASVVFEDVTDKTAMSNFRHRSGSAAKNYNLRSCVRWCGDL